MNENELVQPLGKRGEEILAENIRSGENILIKLKGTFGEGFILTDNHIYIVKWGFNTGNLFGGRCTAFDYRNLTGIEINKSLINGVVELLSPATQSASLSYWGGNNSAQKSNHAITFQRQKFSIFQKAILIGRDMIAKKKEESK
jgi:hypothetical protein